MCIRDSFKPLNANDDGTDNNVDNKDNDTATTTPGDGGDADGQNGAAEQPAGTSRIFTASKKPRSTPPFPGWRKLVRDQLVRDRSRIFTGNEDAHDLGHPRSGWKDVAIGRSSSSGGSSSNDDVPYVLTISLAEGRSADPNKESSTGLSVSRSRVLYTIPEKTGRAWVHASDMADRVVRTVRGGETGERVSADSPQDNDDR